MLTGNPNENMNESVIGVLPSVTCWPNGLCKVHSVLKMRDARLKKPFHNFTRGLCLIAFVSSPFHSNFKGPI